MNAPDARQRRQALGLTCCAMIAFASNSVLCRLALRTGEIDAASFTVIRLGAGALVLAPLVPGRGAATAVPTTASWGSALALFAYAAAFSFAYLRLAAGTGALLLFGAVQLTMVGTGLARGERLSLPRALGLALSIAGLIALTLPAADAPDVAGVALMIAAGVAWGIYSLRGARASAPLANTAGNFLRTLPFAALLALACHASLQQSVRGVLLAIASGGLASGLGYVLWYRALRQLLAVEAALVQLSVPVLAAVAGVLFMGENMSPRAIAAGLAILAGIALALRSRQ